MGATESKPGLTQTWKASGPHGVSQDLVDSLQTSHETDASRARTVELHIQARVSQELKKLQQKETEALNLAHEKLAAAAASSGSGDDQKPSSFTVSKEIDELQKKLDGRKTLRPLPDGVEKARGKVVRCLRENDRRPLDCWQEVESFKAEVRRLEKEWVDKASS